MSSAVTWVDEPEALSRLVDRLSRVDAAAVDTESNSMYVWRERVCLLQVSVPDFDAIVDVLAIDPAPLAGWLADPRCTKVMHAADNDVIALRRDFGLGVCNVFDTMLAARTLGWPQRGLADLLSTHFGVRTDKRWQRFEWSRRPLPREAIEYACTDTRHLLALREIQSAALAETDRLDEFAHACERTTRLQPRERRFDVQGWARIEGARGLEAPARAVLAALWRLREELAQELDRAPYRVLGEPVLLELARAGVTTRQALARVRGVGGPIATRYAARVCDTIAAALNDEPPPWPSAPPRPPLELRRRLEALQRWRRDVGAARGLEPDIVLAKDALQAIAELDPADLEALQAAEILDGWELDRYAQGLLAALAAARG